MSGADPMRARASRVRWARVLAAGAGLAVMPSPSSALSVQEALLLDVPAVALVSAEVKASATVNCGQGPITISPRPFLEVGTGWFVDGRVGRVRSEAEGGGGRLCEPRAEGTRARAGSAA